MTYLDGRDQYCRRQFRQRSAHVVEPEVERRSSGRGPSTDSMSITAEGFHSNDARGDGGIGRIRPRRWRAPPAAKSECARVAIPDLRSETFAVAARPANPNWCGRATKATTEASGPTRRYGIEFANWYTPTAVADRRCRSVRGRMRAIAITIRRGDYVPEALVDDVRRRHRAARSARGAWRKLGRQACRLRYFGPRALTQDGAVHSKATTLLYADLGYPADY